MFIVQWVSAKEPKRSPSRGRLFLLRPICLFSLTQNEKSNITESKRQNRTSQILYTLHSIYTKTHLLQTSILYKLAVNH